MILFVSDVHAGFSHLAAVAARGDTLMILGDLINILDYRTGEGITADVYGLDFARQAAAARGTGDYQAMRRLWSERAADRAEEMREAFFEGAKRQYERMAEALAGAQGYATYGNVDRPDMLRDHLPSGMRFVDGDVVEIDGVRFGFVGGGTPTPLATKGEVTDEEMSDKLRAIGEVDVLCSHLAPAVPSLYTDVITGRPERNSQPILDYINDVQPAFHFFGDVHQPQASRWRIGRTVARNVGYFRATGRPIEFDPGEVTRDG